MLPVVLVPDIKFNLFSVASTTEQGATVSFALEREPMETKEFTIPLQQVRGRSNL